MKKFLRLTNSTLNDYKVKTIKDLWNKVKSDYKGLQIECFTVFKKSRSEENKFHTVFSTAKEDRHGDIVKQEWDLKSYKNNPVLLDSHNYDSIEHIIGGIKPITVKDNKLQGDITFALENPKGLLAYKLAVGGFLNTTSVGFIPKEFDDKGTILKSELLEISAVSVPANPEALMEKLYEGQNNEYKKGNGDIEPEGGDNKEKRKEDKPRQKDWSANWDNGPEYIRLKVRDIADFYDESFQREMVKTGLPRIEGISGISKTSNKRMLQSLAFPKEDGWTLDDARKWFSLHEQELWEKRYAKELSKEDKVKKYLVDLGNQHAESRKRGMQKVLLAIEAIKSATGEAKFAEATKQKETRIFINKAAKKILELKK